MDSTTRRLQLSPFRRRDAVGAGLLTAAALKGSRWQRLYQGIYIERSAFEPHDHRMWCRAAQLLLPLDGAIGGYSAAHVWGVDLLDVGAPVTVTIPHQTSLRAQPGLRVIRTLLPRADVESFIDLRLTTPARTAFDLGRDPDRIRAVIAVDAMLHRRLVTLAELRHMADTHPGWRGVMKFRDILGLAEPGAASPMETRLRLVIVDGGLPRPVAQYRVRDENGLFVGQVDLAYPELRVALEYEGDHHRDQATFRKDVVRFNRLRQAGWAALRFTADDVFKRPRTIVDDVKRAVAEATARFRQAS
jgi:very-short-patch-repair endonuclease